MRKDTKMVATTDQKARLLDLVTGILEMARDGTRDIEAISEVFQIIKERPDFAELFLVGNIINTCTIMCEGSHTASELVKLGKYEWSDDWITDERFRLKEHKPMSRTIELVKLDCRSTSEEVLQEFLRLGLERPTYEDGLYFGVQHPDQQRKRPIVFLHEPIMGPLGHPCVIVLSCGSSDRNIGLDRFEYAWDHSYVFACVRYDFRSRGY